MRALLLVLGFALSLAPAAKAEPLVADLSESVVKITTGFTGTKVLLFGAIKEQGKIVVVVEGPRHSLTVRRKQRVAGIWVNRAEVQFDDVPSFYQVLSSDPLEEWLPLRTRDLYQIGVEYLRFDPRSEVGPAEQARFRVEHLGEERAHYLFAIEEQPVPDDQVLMASGPQPRLHDFIRLG